ncbi:CPBP family intramembrane glutamic endopeptidase [Streptococcus dentiloxodontae]
MFLKNLNIKSIYRWQLVIHAIIIAAYLLQSKFANLPIGILAILSCLLGLLISYKDLPKLGDIVVTCIISITYPLSIMAGVASAAKFLPSSYPLLMLYCLFAFIPVICEFVVPRFKSALFRILLALWWASIGGISVSGIVSYLPAKHGFLYELFASGLWWSLAFFLMAVVMMRAWGFAWPDWKSKGKWQSSALMTMTVFCLYLLLLNNFKGAGLPGLLFPFDVHPFQVTWKFLFTGIKAGLLEEVLFRYIPLLCLLSDFSAAKRVKLGTVGAIFFSSSIFGMIHLTNVFIGQDIPNTVMQSLLAIFIGIPFALIYLYTGKLSLAVLYHAVWDVITFSTSSATKMSGAVDAETFIFTAYLVLVISLFSVYMLTGERRQTIETNVRRLLDKQTKQLKEI